MSLTAALSIGFVLLGSPVALQSQTSPTFSRDDTPAIGAPRSIVSADFNGDGFPDVALGGTARASIGILLNHGIEDGDEGQRFGPLKEIVVGGGPFELATGDFNKDGRPDIAVANADLNALTILLNDPGHQFTAVSHVPVAENPRGLAVADFNRDGKLDVIVTKYMGTTLEILYGAGNGTFTTRRTLPAAPNTQGVAVADFNHDGWPDAVTVSTTGVVTVHTMNATGATRTNNNRGVGYNVVTTGDFNQDGHIDAAYASTANSVVEIMSLRPGVATWSGDPIPVAASPRGIEAGDINQDGTLDLVVAGRAQSMVSILLRQPASSPAVQVYTRHDYAAGAGARDVALADFSRSGRLSVLTANESGDSTTLLTNTAVPATAAFRFERMSLDSYGGSQAYGVADFDHNGQLDILRRNIVLFDGTTPSRVLLPQFGSSARDGAAGDFNRDGHPDAVFTENRSLRVYFGDGARGFTDGPATATDHLEGWQLRAADLNRDGALDLVLLGIEFSSGGGLLVYLGRGDGTFTRGSSTAVPGTARTFDLGDLDRDGVLDAALADQSGLRVFLGNGAGGWKSITTFEEGVPRYGVAIGDVTSDGIPDLVTADMTVYSWGTSWGSMITVARGHGDGTFERIHQYDVGQPGRSDAIYGMLLADLNGDGHADIFTTHGHLLPGTGAGDFGEPQRFAPQAFITGYLAADFNRDGLLDLLGFMSTSPADGGDMVMLNTRTPPSQNRAPTGLIQRDTVPWHYEDYWRAEDEYGLWQGNVTDPDLHAIRHTWKLADGTVLSHWNTWGPGPDMRPGTYEITVTADDYRGGSVSDRFTLVIQPFKETVLHGYQADTHGAWQKVQDPTAAGYASSSSQIRLTHPNAGAPKLQAPLASPTDYVEFGFLADPTQEYKLWIRMKAEGDNWANDSVFVQFTGAKDANGNSVYQLGTTSALAVNLEECSNCGVSGWGWEDDGWGAVNKNGVTLRFPEGGRQIIRIQTREDGVSLDQVVLSAEQFLTARPGSAKNDNTRLPERGPEIGTWWWYNR